MIRDFIDSDEEVVKQLLFELQEFLINEGSNGLLRHFDDGGSEYMVNLLSMVSDKNGKIYVYEQDGWVIGVIAGYVDEISKVDELMTVIKKPGYIAELFVQEAHRGKGYGRALMDTVEKYFAEQGCDVVTVTVDAFNMGARQMYAKTGYDENDILLIKKVQR